MSFFMTGIRTPSAAVRHAHKHLPHQTVSVNYITPSFNFAGRQTSQACRNQAARICAYFWQGPALWQYCGSDSFILFLMSITDLTILEEH
jgi:hypothetical protein